MPYARCKSLTEKGEYIACFTTSKTSQTEKKLIFPKNSIINVRNILWVKKGKEISNCDISKWPKPLKVATTNQYEYVQKFDDYVKNKIISPIMINQETQGLSMVDYERVDAAIVTIDEVKTIEYVKLRAGLKINVVIGCDLGTLKGYISFSKKHKRSKILAEQFDKGIGIITKNGELKKLQLTWSK